MWFKIDIFNQLKMYKKCVCVDKKYFFRKYF